MVYSIKNPHMHVTNMEIVHVGLYLDGALECHLVNSLPNGSGRDLFIVGIIVWWCNNFEGLKD